MKLATVGPDEGCFIGRNMVAISVCCIIDLNIKIIQNYNFACCFIWVWNLIQWRMNIGWRCLRTWCWERYLSLRGIRSHGTGSNCKLWRILICTPHPKLWVHIWATKSKKNEIRWAHITHWWRKNACKVLVGQLDRKKPLGRFDHKCKNISHEIQCESSDWTDLAQNRNKWIQCWTFMFHKKQGIS
jgi:hypothetical protein